MNMRKNAAIVVVAYNVVGTLAVCSVYPSDPLSFLWNGGLWGKYVFGAVYLLTLPVTLFSNIYRMIQTTPLYPVFIIQLLTLLITLYLVDKSFKRRYGSN